MKADGTAAPETVINRPKIQAIVMLRDAATGKPLIEPGQNPSDLHPGLKALMTDDELREAQEAYDAEHP